MKRSVLSAYPLSIVASKMILSSTAYVSTWSTLLPIQLFDPLRCEDMHLNGALNNRLDMSYVLEAMVLNETAKVLRLWQ